MKFSQARMLVNDPAEAFRFYRDELGLTPSSGDEGDDYASFDAGGVNIALFRRDGQHSVSPLRESGDGVLLVLQVDDVAEWAEKLGDRVVAGPSEQKGWGGRVLHLRDPSGNLIELFESISMEE